MCEKMEGENIFLASILVKGKKWKQHLCPSIGKLNAKRKLSNDGSRISCLYCFKLEKRLYRLFMNTYPCWKSIRHAWE